MGWWYEDAFDEPEGRHALRDLKNIFLDPGGELWGGGGVQGDHLFEAALSGGKVGAEEDAAHGSGHSGALVKARDGNGVSS